MQKKVTVVITGVNASDNPGPGLGVARSLKLDNGLDVRVLGLAYDAMEPGIYVDCVIDKSFLVPYPTVNGKAWIERLLHIKRSCGLDFLIPNMDAELPVCIKYASMLAKSGIGLFIPTMRQFTLRSKDRLSEVAERIGVEVPQTCVVHTREQAIEAAQDTGKSGIPVMVKGVLYGAIKAISPSDVVSRFDELMVDWGGPVIIQEVVTGDELNVVGLGDGEGGSLGLVGAKKLSVSSLGKIWTGVTVCNDPMMRAAEAFIREYRWCGPFELECIVRDGTVYLIEINPRFPAWVFFASGVGVNLPSRMLRRSLGMENLPLTEAEPGKLFVRYVQEIVTDMDSLQSVICQGETA